LIYYFSDIALNDEIIKERQYKSSEAGKLRTMFIAEAIDQPVTIVSMATPEKKGIFKPFKLREKQIDEKIKIIYLAGFQFNVFINLIVYFIYISFFILIKIKRNDIILMYNMIPKQTLPIIFMKLIKRFELVIQIEELYSAKKFNLLKDLLNKFVEKLSFRVGDRFLLVNSNLKGFVGNKPTIVTHGYLLDRGFKGESKNIHVKTEWPLVLYTGRLDYEGGVEILLQAINYIQRKCQIIISGKGPLKGLVQNYQPNNSNVIFTYVGFLDNQQYEFLLNEANVCINPIRVESPFTSVSFPSKVLNYLVHGNLVVSSQFIGLYDLSEQLRKRVITYDRDDPRVLAETIEEALNHNINKIQIKREALYYFEQQKNTIKLFFDKRYCSGK